MSERVHPDQEWINLYQPDVGAAEFETKWQPLPEFSNQTPDGTIVIGSGSVRNGRVRDIDREFCQLSQSQAIRQLNQAKLPEAFQNAVTTITEYREPRRMWTMQGDGGLASQKARLTLAAILMIQSQESPSCKHLAVIGRDSNIAGPNGTFFDKAGFTLPPQDGVEVYPPSWTVESDGEPPIIPGEQIDQLYRSLSRIIFTAHSATMLNLIQDDRQIAATDIAALLDFSSALPDWVSAKNQLSFMALRPDEEFIHDGKHGFHFLTLLDYYANRNIHYEGNKLYTIPGIVDWSRRPAVDMLSLWLPREEDPIQTQLSSLQFSLAHNRGAWARFQAQVKVHPAYENELVGMSTKSIATLLHK